MRVGTSSQTFQKILNWFQQTSSRMEAYHCISLYWGKKSIFLLVFEFSQKKKLYVFFFFTKIQIPTYVRFQQMMSNEML